MFSFQVLPIHGCQQGDRRKTRKEGFKSRLHIRQEEDRRWSSVHCAVYRPRPHNHAHSRYNTLSIVTMVTERNIVFWFQTFDFTHNINSCVRVQKQKQVIMHHHIFWKSSFELSGHGFCFENIEQKWGISAIPHINKMFRMRIIVLKPWQWHHDPKNRYPVVICFPVFSLLLHFTESLQTMAIIVDQVEAIAGR